MDQINEKNVINNDGSEYKGTLEGKKKMLYFSAHWCPPCRMFTPMLSKWYSEHKKEDFELIFISSDRDESSFKEYTATMTFPALKFAERDIKQKLASAFGVTGIPSLIVCDEKGEVITKKGREGVTGSPDGFPWAPKPLSEIMCSAPLLSKDGKIEDVKSHLKDKFVALYFSASWCGPCKQFSPMLADCYKTLKEAGKPFEVIFVTSDKDEGAFTEYYKGHPWLAIPFGDARIAQLNDHFEIEGIPTVIGIDGTTFMTKSKELRAEVMEDPKGEKFPWKPEPVSPLDQKFMSIVNDGAVFIVFSPKQTFDELKPFLETSAKGLLDEADQTGKSAKIRFAINVGKNEMSVTTRQFMNMSQDVTTLQAVILDVPNQRKFVFDNVDLTSEFVEKTVTEFCADKLAGQKKIRE